LRGDYVRAFVEFEWLGADFNHCAGGLVLLLASSITAIVAGHMLKIRESNNATQLKQDMLDRGMSADEIKTVLEAGMKR
jgi:hypothetical protein